MRYIIRDTPPDLLFEAGSVLRQGADSVTVSGVRNGVGFVCDNRSWYVYKTSAATVIVFGGNIPERAL